MHDVGKIGLPAGLLEKPGALTLAERRVMETHSEIGERILAEVEDFNDIATIVRHHHERWDGQGYPDGLRGDDIPLISRIIAAADAYNAMTSDRPYRDAMPSRVARMRLAQGVETQFDTTVVAAFEAVLAGAGEDYRLASREDFTFATQDRYSDSAASAFVERVARSRLGLVLEHSDRSLGPRAHAELFVDVTKVGLHRGLADEERLSPSRGLSRPGRRDPVSLVLVFDSDSRPDFEFGAAHREADLSGKP